MTEVDKELLDSIVKEAWGNFSEETKKEFWDAQNRSDLASSGEESEETYFRTLEGDQCFQLCSSGKCNADCCGCTSFLENHFKILKKLIPDGKEYTEIRSKEQGYAYIKPVTKNSKCVFLTDKNTCSIYSHSLRPANCKRFGEDPKEPLFACEYINEEMKEEIRSFGLLFLAQQAGDNPLAQHILKQLMGKSENKENLES